MIDLIVEDNGKKRLKSDVEFADHIMKLKNQKDHWAVVEALIGRWIKDQPDESNALKIQLDDQRELLEDKIFGTTLGGKDFDRRYFCVFPLRLQQLLRAVYANEELTFDQDFYHEFAKRFPKFRVAEKI